jgi:predicted amidohydrolase
MIIALASPSVAYTLGEGLEKTHALIREAAAQDARVVCFPEAYLPGLRGQDFDVLPFEREHQEEVLLAIAQWARVHRIAAVFCTERLTPAGRQIAAYVFDAAGETLGVQTKNQLDPSEDAFYVPGDTRAVFDVPGLRFGIAICHEAWRYPETVRWAAVRGAQVVFQPQHTGSVQDGVRLTQWGARENPYYEQAMAMRSRENTIYFASVNYALPFQESATSLIAPSGKCQAHLPYGQEGVLVQAIDVAAATGLLARRYVSPRGG